MLRSTAMSSLSSAFAPRDWELVAWGMAGVISAIGAGIRWGSAPRQGGPRLRRVAAWLDAMNQRSWPDWGVRVGGLARSPIGDFWIVLVALTMHVGAMRTMWATISPWGSPMGPDSDVTYLSAVAVETGNRSLYSMDRYPAFPWLASLFSPDADGLAAAGLHLSMAATLLTAVAAYGVARMLGGRAAGFIATVFVLRLPGVADAGRQFTPYALIAALDLAGVASLVALLRGRSLAAVPLAVAAAGVFAADPKQVPVAVAFIGVGVLFSLLKRSRAGVAAAAGLLAALPVVNLGLARLNLPIGSIEAITARVPLGFTVDPSMSLDGWTPGASLLTLPGTLLRVATGVQAPTDRGWLEEAAWGGLSMELPSTSPLWLGAVLLLPALVLLRPWGERRWRDVLLPLVVVPMTPVLVSTLHLHFQHRYFLALVVLLPPLVAAGVARLGGPAAVVAVGLVAGLAPTSPWRTLAPGLRAPPSRDSDSWAGPEARDWAATRADLAASLPEDAVIVDYAASRPWFMLAGLRDYHRCTWEPDCCRSRLDDGGSLYAVLYPREGPTRDDAPGASVLGETDSLTAKVGDCWERVAVRPGNGGFYRWSCDTRPQVFTPPPRPAGR